MTTASPQLYRTARTDLDTNGWIKDDWLTGDGQCVAQAIGTAAGIKGCDIPLELSMPLFTTLQQRDDFQPGEVDVTSDVDVRNAITAWNDVPDRLKSDVLAALDDTAAWLEAEENRLLRQRISQLEALVLLLFVANVTNRQMLDTLLSQAAANLDDELFALAGNGGEGLDVGINDQDCANDMKEVVLVPVTAS